MLQAKLVKKAGISFIFIILLFQFIFLPRAYAKTPLLLWHQDIQGFDISGIDPHEFKVTQGSNFNKSFLSNSPSSNSSIPVTGQGYREATKDDQLPTIDEFIVAVSNGDPNEVRGVYVPDILALPVIQQPSDDPKFVSYIPGVVTQFQLASQEGVIGLMAHNFLSGNLFFNLEIGQEFSIVHGDGSMQSYVVSDMFQYQALDSDSVYSDFIDLGTEEHLSSTQLFDKVFSGNHHVTFQTCIEKDGNSTWGRLFIIAMPSEGEMSQ